MQTFNEQEESCWVKMNHHSHFLSQRVLGELLGKKPACVSQKDIPLWKESSISGELEQRDRKKGDTWLTHTKATQVRKA